MTAPISYRDIQRRAFQNQVAQGTYHSASEHGRDQRRFILDVLDAAAGEVWRSSQPISVLDCGMGVGRTLDAIIDARRWAELHVSGFDLTPSMVEECRKRMSVRCDPHLRIGFLKVGDITGAASYTSSDYMETYDLVFCVWVIQQLPESLRARAIERMLAATKPSGSVVVFDREKHSWYGFRMSLRKWLTKWLRMRLVPHYYLLARYPCLKRLARHFGRQWKCRAEVISDPGTALTALVLHKPCGDWRRRRQVASQRISAAPPGFLPSRSASRLSRSGQARIRT